ncbi:hypothetical protein EB093_04295 [bacterium]|nr:hypothetical protein [bacterium]
MVPGLSVYGTLLVTLAAFALPQALHHPIPADTLIFYMFLIILLLPVSLGLISIGNSYLKIVSKALILIGLPSMILALFSIIVALSARHP